MSTAPRFTGFPARPTRDRSTRPRDGSAVPPVLAALRPSGPAAAAAPLVLAALLLSGPGPAAAGAARSAPQDRPAGDATAAAPARTGERGAALRVWLVTAGPGDAVWERYGHNALRVLDTRTGRDVSYNWGVFDFRQANFVARFLRGRMLYTMAVMRTDVMIDQYREADREVTLQELDLTPAEKSALRAAARENALPGNRDYAYRYFLDNCSTRVRDLLDRVLGGALRRAFAGRATGLSYRDHTRRLAQVDPLAHVGADLLLGAPADRPISAWEELFLPLALRDRLRAVRITRNGETRPLVLAEEVAASSARPPEPAEPPAWLGRHLAAGLLLGVLLASGERPWVRRSTALRRSVLALAAAWSLLAGGAGSVLLLLLATDHTFTWWNENLFLFNPLLLGVAVLLPLSARSEAWRRRARTLSAAVAGLALAGLVWQAAPASTQRNAAFLALALPPHLGVAWSLRRRRAAPGQPPGVESRAASGGRQRTPGAPAGRERPPRTPGPSPGRRRPSMRRVAMLNATPERARRARASGAFALLLTAAPERARRARASGATALLLTAAPERARRARASGAFALLLTAAFAGAPAAAGAQTKNVILFVGDGMGVSTVSFTRFGVVGVDGELVIDQFPYTALSRTSSADHITPDSAATMTAMTTGVNTNSGVIGYPPTTERADFNGDGDGVPLTNVAELAKGRGYSVGIVTTTRLTHATPAAVYAHVHDRNLENDIAAQLTPGGAGYNRRLGNGLDVLFGGGRRFFLPTSMTDEEGNAGRRTDGRDLRAEFKQRGYTYVWNQAGFQALPANPGRVLGLFESSHLEYEFDRLSDAGGEPSLTAMTRKAIRILEARGNPYFLMVESGRIDHAHHAGNAYRSLYDTAEFDEAVGAATWEVDLRETMILVTADHSHVFTLAGYAMRPLEDLQYVPKSAPSSFTDQPWNGIFGNVYDLNPRTGEIFEVGDANDVPYTILGYANGPGYRTGPRVDPNLDTTPGYGGETPAHTASPAYRQEATVPLRWETHSAEDVAVYGIGAGSQVVRGTVPNTRIFDWMVAAMGLDGLRR